jgi:drug/metabolite transporter (DMT)-like permease
MLVARGRTGELVTSAREHWRRALVMGALNPFAYYLVLLEAYDRLPAQEAQAINYTWALTMTLLAAPLLHHRLALRDIVAALACYAGVLVIATRGDVASLELSDAGGVTLALGSTVVWALYWLLNTRDRRDPVLALTLNFLASLPMIVVWCAATGALGPVSWHGAVTATYVGLFEMGVTFVLWLSAMRLTTSTARIANLIFLSPPASLLLIHLVLGEPIYPSTPIGLGLILGGLAWQRLAPRLLRASVPGYAEADAPDDVGGRHHERTGTAAPRIRDLAGGGDAGSGARRRLEPDRHDPRERG